MMLYELRPSDGKYPVELVFYGFDAFCAELELSPEDYYDDKPSDVGYLISTIKEPFVTRDAKGLVKALLILNNDRIISDEQMKRLLKRFAEFDWQ